MRKYTIEEMAKGRRWYVEFKEKNQFGEKILVEFSYCEKFYGPNSLPNMWYKNGYIDRVLKNYWWISTYAEDGDEIISEYLMCPEDVRTVCGYLAAVEADHENN